MRKRNCPAGWTPRLRTVSLVRALVLLTVGLFAAGPAAALEYREQTLDNGLQVILVRESKAPVVVSQLWYRVGASDEVDGRTGLAHMLEHMMFQGTRTLAPKEFSRIIARNGGDDNAFTSLDYTTYHTKVAADRLELALRLEAERMHGLLLRESEFTSENLVVREERRTRTDANPSSRFRERYRALAYGDHPYGRPVIGWMADIEGLTLADLEAWYRRYYAPNNAILVVVGDVDFARTLDWVQTYFGPLPAQPGLERAPLPELTVADTPRRIEVSDQGATLATWMAGYPAPGVTTAGAADRFALEVLAKILGGGASSRLYRRLVVERRLAVSAAAGYDSTSRGPPLFALSAVPNEGVAIAALERAMFDEAARMAIIPVSERELEMAKNSLIAAHVYAQDSVEYISSTIGQMTIADGDWRTQVLSYPERIRAVSAGEVQKMAARYLREESVVVGVLTP